MSKYTIGIDLGGTTMTAGIVNESYEIIGKLTWATRLPPGGGSGKGHGRFAAARWPARIRLTLPILPMSASAPRQRELHHRLCRLQHQLWLL